MSELENDWKKKWHWWYLLILVGLIAIFTVGVFALTREDKLDPNQGWGEEQDIVQNNQAGNQGEKVTAQEAFVGASEKTTEDITAAGEASTSEGTVQDSTATNSNSNSAPVITPTAEQGIPSYTGGNALLAPAGGALGVKGTDLVDCNGNPIQLRGVSTMGLQWYGQYVTYEGFQTLRDDWGANLIRLALYTHENGYCSGGNKTQLMQTVENGVQYATELGMYVIIDWHVLNERSPKTYESEAVSFFTTVAQKYADYSNVIYEICNEPNGCNWSDVKSYAEKIIPIIRQYDSDAIILVGTPTWSQLDAPCFAQTGKILDCDTTNVMYVCHFYAATHKDDLRNKVKKAIACGHPVFISEFSICDASGNGGIDYTSAKEWTNLINSYNLSYAGWSLCNKNETSALISSSVSKKSGWATSELSDTGRYLRSMISDGAPDYAGTPDLTEEQNNNQNNNNNNQNNNNQNNNNQGDWNQPQPQTEKVGGTFQFDVTIQNNTGADLSGWSIHTTLPGGASIFGSWCCEVNLNGADLSLTDAGYNGTIPAGGSVGGIGIQISSPTNLATFTVEENGITATFTMGNSW